jgi:hypothetical protein
MTTMMQIATAFNGLKLTYEHHGLQIPYSCDFYNYHYENGVLIVLTKAGVIVAREYFECNSLEDYCAAHDTMYGFLARYNQTGDKHTAVRSPPYEPVAEFTACLPKCSL